MSASFCPICSTPIVTDFLAATTWATLDVEAVWHSLDHLIVHLDTPGQIQFAGRAIEHLIELFITLSEQVLEELDSTLTEDSPQMTVEQFLPFVRQSMEIDFLSLSANLSTTGNADRMRLECLD